MKISTFTQAVALMLLIAFAASCGTSHPTSRYPERYPDNDRSVHRLPPGQQKKVYGDRSARVYAPGQRKKSYRYPLIIVRRPGMYISRSRDGRYYFRNADGFYYWQGYDDRLYLDERHLSQIEYDRYSYDEWRDRGRSNASRYKQRRY